jgi:hypothetical protein
MVGTLITQRTLPAGAAADGLGLGVALAAADVVVLGTVCAT